MSNETVGMREIESASHEHEFGPWQQQGSEMVLLTKVYVQARKCLDPRCNWTQWARSVAGAVNSSVSVRAKT